MKGVEAVKISMDRNISRKGVKYSETFLDSIAATAKATENAPKTVPVTAELTERTYKD